MGQGKTVKEACKQLEISEQTYYRGRREYGGMDVTPALTALAPLLDARLA
ncbi:transposase [bacterium]|nr:transposase [bacterium]